MKKLFAILISIFLVLSPSCAQGSKSAQSTSSAQTTSTKKSLVVFYTFSNNTRTVANRLAELTGSDIYEVKTVKSYPTDYHETAVVSMEERRTGKLPEIKNDFPDLAQYDVIYIGGPIWNSYMPTPLEKYVELHDFKGKIIVPFSTSMGSGISVFRNDLVARAKNPVEVKQGVNIVYPNNARPNAISQNELDKILKEIIIEKSATISTTVRLNSGYEMPIVGLGTWTQNDSVAENSVYIAIKNGYRLIDTAAYYGNEVGVGKGVRRAISEGIVTRKEVFVTSKVVPWGTGADYEKQIDECNTRLGLEYIDLMLIHQRGSGEKELYRAIEKKISDGTVKSLGISNYYTPREFDEITKGAKIMPAVIQNENHIFYQNTELQKYVAKFGTIIESYYPFGGRGHTRDSLENKTISEIAKSHGKTSAQVILRWHIQAGYITIPGSQNESHIKENISIFDFELTDDEMKKIAGLNTGRRYENW